MTSSRRHSRTGATAWGLFGIAAACVLIGAAGFLTRSPADADRVHVAGPAAKTDTAAVAGPAAGEIPAGLHPGPTAQVPAVQRLAQGLRAALISAQRAMQADGLQLWITSGWRTTAYQQRLYDEAVAQRGLAYASTHVAAPDKTEHTKGNAVDIGPTDADDWLIRNGAQYGLCQTYANEIWHFELTAVAGRCPAQLQNALG